MTKRSVAETKQATTMLAISKQGQQAVQAKQLIELHKVLLLWGVVWLLQFGVLWFARTTDTISYTASLWLAGGTTVAGIVATVALSHRQNADIDGVGHDVGARLLWGWLAAIASIYLCVTALHLMGIEAATIHLFALPFLICVIIGLALLLSGLLLRNTPSTFVGGWLLLLSVIVLFMDVPTNLGFLAFVGGGAMIVAAGLQWYVSKRQARA